MAKRENETFLEYKKRVIDPVSACFCAAKWYNATIWLNSGDTTSCHHPPQHPIDLDEIKDNPSAIHNTAKKKEQRRKMLAGERPKGCEYCWVLEDMNKDAVSDRIFKSVIYTDDDIKKAVEMGPDANVDLKTLEVAFDRTCNFACSYCNATFSTTWGKDIIDNGAYKNLLHRDGMAYGMTGKHAQPYKNSEDNPYIQAFWRWWPTLVHTLQEFRITGGEPLLSYDVWKVLDYFQENGSGKMVFAINTNLGARDELVDKLIEKSHYIEKFDLYTSCEAFGKQAEYIRDGMNFDQYCKNLEKCMNKGNFRSINMMMTINGLCLFSICDFLDKMMDWKKQYGAHFPTWTVNLLRFPSFMSGVALSRDLRKQRKADLEAWMNKNGSSDLLLGHEIEGLKRLIDYLDEVDKPHRNAGDETTHPHDFKSFYKQYDERRGKSLNETFPKELINWLDSVEENA